LSEILPVNCKFISLVRDVWGSNPEPIKSPTRCQRLATVATLIVWDLAQSRGDGHRSLVAPERVLSEYNKDLIFFWTSFKFLGCI